MEPIYVIVTNFTHFEAAEGGQHQVVEHGLLVFIGPRHLADRMFGKVALGKRGHTWGCAIFVSAPHGIFTKIDFAFQPLGLLSCSRYGPVRIGADGVATLPARYPVVQNERSGAGSGNANAEPLYLGVIGYSIGRGWRGEGLYRLVCQLLCHGSS